MKTINNVLRRAEIIPDDLHASRGAARAMGTIPDDVMAMLSAEQKVQVVRDRLAVCKPFQAQLEAFWRKHYDKMIWSLVMKKDPMLAIQVGEAYKALTRADFNVSHEANRDIDHLERFIKGIERKEMPMEDKVRWAMMAASSMPTTFLSAFDVYTGRTEIDIRPFFPDLDFTQCEVIHG